MTIYDLIEDKGYTLYKLSKESGVPHSTLHDIFSGKSDFLDCRLRVILKIAKVLNVSVDELVKLDSIPYNPIFEKEMPPFLKESIDKVRDRRNWKSTIVDAYFDEAISSINVCEVEKLISKEHADYLRKKYIWG